jgi:hypothetical protein
MHNKFNAYEICDSPKMTYTEQSRVEFPRSTRVV